MFRPNAGMPEKICETGIVAQKISKGITYYQTAILAVDEECPAMNEAAPTPAYPPTQPNPFPSNSRHDCSSNGSTSLSDPLSQPRPLLLLLPWLGARSVAVTKYRDLYLTCGVDVLSVESSVTHFLWPRWGLEYGLEILRVLEEPRFAGRPLLVHAFSIGGYTFSQMLTHVVQRPEEYASLTQRVLGHIYDSLVVGTLQHMATGLGKTLYPRWEHLVRNAAMLYFRLFKAYTTDYYTHAIHVFNNNPMTAPALFFFCENDPLSDPVAVEAVVDLWRKRGVAVESKKWEKSVHAAHMRCHTEDYLSTLHTFLNSVSKAQLRPNM